MSSYVVIGLVIGLVVIFLAFSKKRSGNFQERDAKGFAKLLFTEIKLYETDKLEKGLAGNSILESLAYEIGAARAKYRKRFADPEFEKFFDEALIEVLANGDRNKLGTNKSASN